MSLYRVSVNTTVMVEADSKDEAVEIADRCARDWACDIDVTDYSAHAVTALSSIPVEWRDSLPWGTATERTCEQMVSEGAP